MRVYNTLYFYQRRDTTINTDYVVTLSSRVRYQEEITTGNDCVEKQSVANDRETRVGAKDYRLRC